MEAEKNQVTTPIQTRKETPYWFWPAILAIISVVTTTIVILMIVYLPSRNNNSSKSSSASGSATCSSPISEGCFVIAGVPSLERNLSGANNYILGNSTETLFASNWCNDKSQRWTFSIRDVENCLFMIVNNQTGQSLAVRQESLPFRSFILEFVNPDPNDRSQLWEITDTGNQRQLESKTFSTYLLYNQETFTLLSSDINSNIFLVTTPTPSTYNPSPQQWWILAPGSFTCNSSTFQC